MNAARQSSPAAAARAANDDGTGGSRPALTEPQKRLAAVLADVLYRDLRSNPPPR